MRIYILPVLITLLIITSFCSSVYAVDLESSLSASMSAEILPTGNDIGISKITPASFFYFLKTIRENLEMKMALTPHVKQIRLLEFATRRLREAKSLIGIKEDLISPTLERYWFHINSL